MIPLEIDGRCPVVHVYLKQAAGYEFLLHLRALTDFLFPTRCGDDDVLATDFVGPDPSARTAPAWLRELIVHLNKRLAHITSRRWKEEPAPDMKYYHQHAREIDQAITSFHSVLPAELSDFLTVEMRCFADRDAAVWTTEVPG